MRNPKRTASTASALMIGAGACHVRRDPRPGNPLLVRDAVDDLFKADYALTSQDGFTPLTIEAENAVAKAPGVTAISGIRAGSARVFGNMKS